MASSGPRRVVVLLLAFACIFAAQITAQTTQSADQSATPRPTAAQQRRLLVSTGVAEPGGACGPAAGNRCPDTQCCSGSGFCGITAAHCAVATCQKDWGTCGSADPSPVGEPTTAVPGGACGPTDNAICGSNQCCSAAGFCGVTPDHCVGATCQTKWGKCGNEFVQSPVISPDDNPQPTNTTQLAVMGGPCGPANNARCPGNQCCSAAGFCGTSPEHCGKSCFKGWGTCDGDNGPNTPQPPVQEQQGGGTKLTPNQIVGIASGIITGCVALIAGAYAIWKWHHKRLLLNKARMRQADPLSDLPRVKDVGNV